MTTAINQNLVILAARNSTIQYVEQGHAAIRRLEGAYAKLVAILPSEYEGRRDALTHAIRAVDDPMSSVTTIENALRTLIARMENLDAWLVTKAADSTRAKTTTRVVDDRRLDTN